MVRKSGPFVVDFSKWTIFSVLSFPLNISKKSSSVPGGSVG